ncbi:MAG TPA: DUF2298 domain-containing protein [Thermomicrobiales bacterium]|nr:DUF2298 domain-containing protein [Thermomicrobiales bacterium]
MSDWEALFRWYLVLSAVTVALYPVVSVIGSGLGGARYGLARPLGIVLLTAIVWWPASLFGLPFTSATLWIALIVSGSLAWAWWRRASCTPLQPRAILAFEGLWLASFLGYAWFRSHNPDIINTEKPMEIALLSSITRSSLVPAPDPWLFGESINYYYFGYQMFAGLNLLSGVPANIGFNLALATLFASTACAVAAAAHCIGRALGMSERASCVAAGLATTLTLLAGNLETPRRLLSDARSTIDAGWWDGVGWQASRIIVDTNVHELGDTRSTINEFPAFAFVLGDLHPHVITYPLLASMLAIAISFALAGPPIRLESVAVAGALAGVLYASNSWDAPLGLLLLIGGLSIAHVADMRRLATSVGVMFASAIAAVLPFTLHYTAPVGVTNHDLPTWLTSLPVVGMLANTIGIVYWRPSGLRELFVVHGLWLAAFAAFVGVMVYRDTRAVDTFRRRPHITLIAGLSLLGVSVAWAPAALVILIPLSLALWIVGSSHERGTQVLAGLFGVGFLLILIPEVLFLQDAFMDRMNTVFKFYFQAWLLLAVASAVSFVYGTRVTRGFARAVVVTAVTVAVGLSLTYTPLSAWDWTNGFETRWALDGSVYLARSAPDDLAAIGWVSATAGDDDWLVEAPGCSYVVLHGAPMSRVSAFSGVPGLVGWHGHEGQWRRGESDDIYRRLDDRVATANAILDGRVSPSRDGPSFVVLGQQERLGSAHCDLVSERSDDVFERMIDIGWVVGFESAQTLIFVPPWHPAARGDR